MHVSVYVNGFMCECVCVSARVYVCARVCVHVNLVHVCQ